MDEYKVSFNSDTSDSEEEESHTVVKTAPAVGVANNVSVNGDTTTANETTEETSRSGGIKALIEPTEVSADGCLVNGDAGPRKHRGKNKDNIVATANGMNGVSDTSSEGGRTVISAKDGILRTGSGQSQAAIDNVGETSDAEPLKSSCSPSGPEEPSADPGCTAARGVCTDEESFDAQQVTPDPDTSVEPNIRENGHESVPSCDASVDLGDVGTFTLSTELLSDPAGQSDVPESSFAEASSDVIVIETTSGSVENEISAELSTSTDADNANDNKAGSDLQAPGSNSNVDSAETSELASAPTRAGRGTDDKRRSSEENMDDYRRPTGRPMDETELLIQRILAEAKAEASGDSSAKEKVPTERTRSVSGDGEPSLRDRRGLDTRLGNLFPSDDRWEDTAGYEPTPSWVDYRGRRDVNAMRSRFRDNGRQYEQGTYRDADGGYRGRYGGRYDDEEDEEIVFEDSEFVPQRREETEEVVKEKTTDIRNMVDKQATVLQKLKEASESFDDISAEIRAIKQDFLESQYRRSFTMDDDDYDDGPSYYSYQPDSYRRDVPRYTSAYAGTYESPYPRPALTLDPELESDLPVAHRSLGSLATTWAYANGGDRSRYATTSSYYPSSRYTSGLTSTSSYSSRSLFDDDIGDEDTEERYGSSRALAPRDDDEDSTSGTRSYSFDSALSSGTSTVPSYRSKYGLTSSLYSSGVGRYTGVLPRASTLPDPTEHTGFTSRFLSKVRDQKSSGDEPRSPKRDKPFKSRFLRKSYDSDYGSHASTPATTPSPVSHFPVLSAQPTADTTAVLDTDSIKLARDHTTA